MQWLASHGGSVTQPDKKRGTPLYYRDHPQNTVVLLDLDLLYIQQSLTV